VAISLSVDKITAYDTLSLNTLTYISTVAILTTDKLKKKQQKTEDDCHVFNSHGVDVQVSFF